MKHIILTAFCAALLAAGSSTAMAQNNLEVQKNQAAGAQNKADVQQTQAERAKHRAEVQAEQARRARRSGNPNAAVQAQQAQQAKHAADVQARQANTTQGAANVQKRQVQNLKAYQRNARAPRRIRIGVYNRPAGWYSHRWVYGERLPRGWFAANYYINDFLSIGLVAPPYGYQWVRVGNDALLVDVETGEVVQVDYDAFY